MAFSQLARSGLQRALAPVVDFLIARGVSPNSITTFGTIATVIGGGFYARGHIHLAGWIVGLSAFCDLLDGTVARRSGQTSVFGAFYDSTLDRIADGAVLGGLALYFARNGVHHDIPDYMSTPMVSVILLGILGSFLTSYTRARAEGLGIDAQVGMLQRPERIFLLSAPQAFFGLALGGWVLMAICALLTVTAWITVVQRIAFVHRVTSGRGVSTKGGPAAARPAPDTAPYDASGRLAEVALAAGRIARGDGDRPPAADLAPGAEPLARRSVDPPSPTTADPR